MLMIWAIGPYRATSPGQEHRLNMEVGKDAAGRRRSQQTSFIVHLQLRLMFRSEDRRIDRTTGSPEPHFRSDCYNHRVIVYVSPYFVYRVRL